MKLIIFDFDGVLDDNYELHYQLSKKKITDISREEHRKLFEGNIHVEREKMKNRDTGFDFLSHFNNARKNTEIEEDVKRMLLELSQKYDLGIISSGKEENIKNCLIQNQIDKLFSFIYGFETHKIKFNKFKKVFDEFNVGKEDCLFVTDTLGDILEANQIGIKTIALDSGYHERERLVRGNPAVIISDIKELVPTIPNLL